MNIKNLVLLTDYMILFPVKWYNLVHRVIARSTVYNNVIIIAKSLTVTCKESLSYVFDLLKDSKMIREIGENKDFYILYFEEANNIRLFDCWLNLVTLRACLEVFEDVHYSDAFQESFEIIADSKSIYVNPKMNRPNGICVTLNKKNKNNVVTYNFNFFAFCEQLQKTYHLLS